MLNTSSTGGLLEPGEATAIAPEARPFTERTEYQKDFTWIRTALQYTAELLKDITAVLDTDSDQFRGYLKQKTIGHL